MKKFSSLVGTILTLIPLNPKIISKTILFTSTFGIPITWTYQARAENAELYLNRGASHMNNRDHQAAIKEFSKIIDFYPSWYFLWGAYYNRALNYEKLDNYELAVNDYTKSIELNPNESDTYYRRGWLLHNKFKKYKEAIFDYDNAIKLNPIDTPSYLFYWRGKAKWGVNDFFSAIEDHKKVIKFEPNNLDAYFWLAMAHQQDEVLKGDPISPYEKSVGYLDRVISAKAFDGDYDGWNYAEAYFQRSYARFMLRDLYIQTLDAHDRQIEKKYNKIYKWSEGYGNRPIMVDFPFQKRVKAVTPLLEGSCSDMRKALTLGVKYNRFTNLITDAC